MEDTPRKRRKPLKGRGGLVMAGILAAMIAFIWWDRGHGKPKEPGAEPQAWEFIGVSHPESVSRLEVRGVAQPYTLQKKSDGWRLLAPVAAPATKQPIEDGLKSLLEASVEHHGGHRVPQNKLQQYGLDRPAMEILLTDGGHHVLQVGNEDKQSGIYWAREKGDQRVFGLSTFAANAFKNKKPEDFRDKSLLGIGDAEKVQRVEIDGSKGRVALERHGTDWVLTSPLSAPADNGEVSSLLSEAKGLEAKSFMPGGAADLPRYGLDRPRVTIAVTDDQGRHTAMLGAETKDKTPQLYALRRGEPDVMLVDPGALAKLDKGAAEFRSKQMLSFDTSKAQRVSVRGPAGSFELQKRGADWWLVKPVSARADSIKVESLLSAVVMSAVRLVDERPTDLNRYGLRTPALEATFQVSGEPEMRYYVGTLAPGPQKVYYARSSKSSAVYEISQFTWSSLNLKPDDLKAK